MEVKIMISEEFGSKDSVITKGFLLAAEILPDTGNK
jgi:hypothetical protein